MPATYPIAIRSNFAGIGPVPGGTRAPFCDNKRVKDVKAPIYRGDGMRNQDTASVVTDYLFRKVNIFSSITSTYLPAAPRLDIKV